jgi:hypothetical protein
MFDSTATFRSPVFNFLSDTYASFASVCAVLYSLQTLVVGVLALGSPCFYYYYRNEDGDPLAFDMNWCVRTLSCMWPYQREHCLHVTVSLRSA